MTFPFKAEIRLLRWAESSTAGRTITIELPPDDGEGHPFKGMPTGHQHGQRFHMMFVPIADDETSPDPAPPAPARPAEIGSNLPEGQGRVPRSTLPGATHDRSLIGKDRYRQMSASEKAVVDAALLAKDPEFQAWILADSEEEAADFIRLQIGGSRSRIADDPEAYEAFQRIKTDFALRTGRMAEVRG